MAPSVVVRSHQHDMERTTTHAAVLIPWEVLFLISHFLQPETLLRASFVCKSWRQLFTSDHLWQPICLASYPSSLRLLISGIPPYNLFSLFFSASKRRYSYPSPLRLSLNQLFFAIEIFHGKESLASVLQEALPRNDCTFQFEADLTEQNVALLGDKAGEMTAAWTVVMKGLNGAFGMMEREAKGRTIGGDHTRIWFSEQLPLPDWGRGLMPEGEGASMEAEMVVEMGDGEESSNGRTRRVVQRVGLGLISGCRYVALEDGLRYLQYFLLGNRQR